MIRSLPRIRSSVVTSTNNHRSNYHLSSSTLSRTLSSFSSTQISYADHRRCNNHYSITHSTSNNNWTNTRQFSSSSDEPKEKKKDLRESIERLKNESTSDDDDDSNNKSSSSNNDNNNNDPNPHIEKLTSLTTNFLTSISETWEELIASGQAKDINKKIGTNAPSASGAHANYADDDEAADKYEEYKGSKEIMMIDEKEELSAWERMERRLRDAPIIQDILEKSEAAYEKSGAKTHVQKTQQKITHLKEDAEEAWETSQNPWVYRASSVYDTLTAESEFATASRQLRTLDPDFTLENWKRDVVEHTLPNIMKLFLEGRIQELKPWLGEAVYNRLAAEGRARKKEGVQMDTNVLAIMNAEILACELEGSSVNVERGDDPIILLHFMCQQIHCVRKKVKKKGGEEKEEESGSEKEGKKEEEKGDGEDAKVEGKGAGDNNDNTDSSSSSGRTYMDDALGEIVEGSEDDIRANSYVIAFQREYNEEKMELNWKIVDFRFNGAIAYL